MENKGVVTNCFPDVCNYFKCYIHFYKLFLCFIRHGDNNVFNIVYDQQGRSHHFKSGGMECLVLYLFFFVNPCLIDRFDHTFFA